MYWFFTYVKKVEENFCLAQTKETMKSTTTPNNMENYKATINLQQTKV